MESFWIYFLLLIAVMAGWILGRLSAPRSFAKDRATNDMFADYFVGLNYLLNDEPDEAIDTFIKALETNNDTVETHLALGALLRRRGKVDKAIKVHQALLARPGLDKSFTDSTRLQLSIDYISAGLLDRAERLLKEILSEGSNAKWEALRHLITIYQREKEWGKAIDCSTQLLTNNNHKRDIEIRAAAAHYCCELAEQNLISAQNSNAKDEIKRAFAFDRKNVRASLLLARIEQRLGNFKSAIKELVRIRTNNPEFTSQVLGPLAECYEQIHNMPEYEKLLTNTLPDEPDVSVVLALSDLVKNRAGDEAAIEFLNDYLTRKPSLAGLVELLKLQIPRADSVVSSNLSLLQQMVDRLVRKNPAYQCNHCGYEARSLYWLCPSCQKWDRIKPILEAVSA
ncbi:MAG: lipopolysaccharide assembly protein LapB [Pseudomonadales bacterium]|nr:lipopolysaccharide assembly protein LapB [Pseudomonadales bacterium]